MDNRRHMEHLVEEAEAANSGHSAPRQNSEFMNHT